MHAMTWKLLTLVCLVVLLVGSLPSGLASSAPEPERGDGPRRHPRTAPEELFSSVVVRPDRAVAAAGVDPAAYAVDRYVVDFRDDVADPLAAADELGARLGFAATHVFRRAPAGFAARLSADALTAVQSDPRVTRVAPDAVIPYQVMPTGVRRIGTRLNATARLDDVDGSGHRVNADVAILDSGVDRLHPDLNVVGGVDCTGLDDPYFDEAGHGTHIAGTIGALDDGVGVVGVAPGARLWSIKVGADFGVLLSWELCGLATLVDNANRIEVANLSFGGPGADGSCASAADHHLICDAVSVGVTVVVAARNEGESASSFVPATFAQVITVSAFVDTDGAIGSKGPNTADGDDDAFASFSNHGGDIDLAAPGVDILSTWPTYFGSTVGNGLQILSGTSMAAPHVAGAAALYIAKHGRVGPSAVKSGLHVNSDAAGLPGDPDGIREPVLYVGAIGPACALSPTSGRVGKAVTVTCTKFRADEGVRIYWDSTSADFVASFTASSSGAGSATFNAPSAVKGAHLVISRGRTSRKQTTDTHAIKPSLTLAPGSGGEGASVTVRVRGFVKGETITVKWFTTSATTRTLKSGLTVSSIGGASFTFKVPAGTTGAHKVEATGSNGTKAATTFTLTAPTPTLSRAPTKTPTSPPAATSTATATATPTATTGPADAEEPSATPTEAPTEAPTPTPTPEPPTEAPTEAPTAAPTDEPTSTPTTDAAPAEDAQPTGEAATP